MVNLEVEFAKIAKNIEAHKSQIFCEKLGSIRLSDLVEEEHRCDGKYAALHRKIDFIRANRRNVLYREEFRFPQVLLDPIDGDFGYIDSETKEFRRISLVTESLDDSDRVQASIEGSYELTVEEQANLESYEIDEKITINEVIQEFWTHCDAKEKHTLALLMYKHNITDLLGGIVGEEIRSYVNDIDPECKMRDYEINVMLGFSPNDNARKGFNRLLSSIRSKLYSFLDEKEFFTQGEKDEWTGSVLVSLRDM